MKMEVTYSDLYNVFGACSSTAQKMVENKQKGNGKFLNFLFNNRDKARVILMEFEKGRPVPNEKLKEFIAKEQEILKSGTPVKDAPEETPEEKTKKEAERKTALEALKLEYKDALDDWGKERDAFNEKLDKVVGFDPVMLKEENLPTEIDADAMEVFYKFVIQK